MVQNQTSTLRDKITSKFYMQYILSDLWSRKNGNKVEDPCRHAVYSAAVSVPQRPHPASAASRARQQGNVCYNSDNYLIMYRILYKYNNY